MWTRRLLGGGSAVLASALLVKEEKTPAWRVEYPTLVVDNNVKLSRKIINEHDQTNLGLRLYQYQTCPYCCKLRAFLDYYGFSYEVVEVNPVTRTQLKFSPDYKKVPVITSSTTDRPLVESSLIISVLKTYLTRSQRNLQECLNFYPSLESVNPENGKPVTTYPNKFFVMVEEEQGKCCVAKAREEREWREWVDDHFIHLISPNVYRTWAEALETFQYFDRVGEWDRNFPAWERYLAVYVGAAAMFGISKRLKKRHQIDDERAAMKTACETWLAAIGPNRKFLGGDLPNLADLALYGAINSFVGCRAFEEMRKETRIGDWYDAVHQKVIQKAGSPLIAAKSKAIAAQSN
uniref:Prostaglandin E synthase 2 n=1 Tax=Panagrellus redivivus TaxID=6233 RepID=A0A7E4ZVK8_PANRE